MSAKRICPDEVLVDGVGNRLVGKLVWLMNREIQHGVVFEPCEQLEVVEYIRPKPKGFGGYRLRRLVKPKNSVWVLRSHFTVLRKPDYPREG